MNRDKWIYTPFGGKQKTYNSLSEACRDLGLNENSIRVKVMRRKRRGITEPYHHVWRDGKLERL